MKICLNDVQTGWPVCQCTSEGTTCVCCRVVFKQQILEGMPCTDEVEQLLKVLGPFYEQVEEKKQIHQVSDLSAGTVTTFSNLISYEFDLFYLECLPF